MASNFLCAVESVTHIVGPSEALRALLSGLQAMHSATHQRRSAIGRSGSHHYARSRSACCTSAPPCRTCPKQHRLKSLSSTLLLTSH